jgi:hypothetical protein
VKDRWENARADERMGGQMGKWEDRWENGRADEKMGGQTRKWEGRREMKRTLVQKQHVINVVRGKFAATSV